MMYFSKEELEMLMSVLRWKGINPKAQELIEKLKHQLESME